MENNFEPQHENSNDSSQSVGLLNLGSEVEFQDIIQTTEFQDDCPSSYANFYKKLGDFNTQSKRRKQLLDEQKKRRNKSVDEARGLLSEYEEIQMEFETLQPKKPHKVKKYRNKIMLSEWLLDIPEDLNVSWFMKICPSGHRCLIVARKHMTKCFSRNGKYERTIKSVLPGGNSLENAYKGTILDCLWIPGMQTFYVLDILMWAGQDFSTYDAEFRFFWLGSRLYDQEELSTRTVNNTFPFIYIPHLPCTPALIVENFNHYPFYTDDKLLVDGILFFHKEANYTIGKTPLVGWLKPYMIPEILNLPVAAEYMKQKPAKYINLKQHIEYGKSFYNKTNAKKEAMETEES